MVLHIGSQLHVNIYTRVGLEFETSNVHSRTLSGEKMLDPNNLSIDKVDNMYRSRPPNDQFRQLGRLRKDLQTIVPDHKLDRHNISVRIVQ